MTRPRADHIHGDSTWQRVDFISDIHLDASEEATFQAWKNHLEHTPAQALFILGDLFEVWVGDDTPEVFAHACLDVLTRTAQRLPVYFLCGNRDFLFSTQTPVPHVHLLDDPCVLNLGQHNFLLSHGDAWCLDDVDYLAFRAQVRQPTWQHDFLSKPWQERHAIGLAMRQQSQAKHAHTQQYADVDTQAARQALLATNSQTLIHGHTHRPAQHDLDDHLTRWVLSDWDARANPPRLEVLSWLRDQEQSPTRGLCRLPIARP
jgi:UDP-2,3-diacylglucosamine hydrolase